MKRFSILSLLALFSFLIGCEKAGIDGDTSFLNSATVTHPGQLIQITNDNSGKVTITPMAEGATAFIVQFGHGSGQDGQAEVMPGHHAIHYYPEGNYTVTIVSKSLSGEEVTSTYPLEVIYRAPENLQINTGVSTHTLTVSAQADYAASFMVYFGDVAGEEGTPLAKDGEVTHNYADAGDYEVKVVALSGGAATAEKTAAITIVDPFGMPITFDNPYINYFFGTFGDNQHFFMVENPSPSGINTTANVGKFVRGVQGWSGTYSPLDNPIDMAMGNVIKVLVYNPDPTLIGAKLNVELESGSSLDNGVAVLKTAVTTSGQWEELTFDFGAIAAIPSDETFSQLVLRFNDGSNGAGAIIYVDNFIQTN